jgi:hypothetical protein
VTIEPGPAVPGEAGDPYPRFLVEHLLGHQSYILQQGSSFPETLFFAASISLIDIGASCLSLSGGWITPPRFTSPSNKRTA